MTQKTHINGATQMVGLLGWPVSHSLSPKMHNRAFSALKLNWAYIPLPIAPENIKDATRSLRAFNFVGANVTVPHKQAIMRYMDELDPAAQAIGAVNTVAWQDGRFRGYNTDCYGFLESLRERDFDPAGKRCLVLGAGGAARAVVYSLASAGATQITVCNRTVERAAFLVDDLKLDFEAVQFASYSLSQEALRQADGEADLVVNTTSVGMHPHVDASPWPKGVELPPAVICDLVYNPPQTKFLQQADEMGLKTIDGVGMLVHQGAKAFEIWTGHAPPTEVMRQAVLSGLGLASADTAQEAQ